MTLTIPQLDWQPVVPLALLMMASLLVLIGSLFMEREEESTLVIVALAGVVAAGFSTIRLWGATTQSVFFGMLNIDHFGLVIALIVLLAAGGSILLAAQDEALGAEYLALILLATLGMVLLGEASNLMTVFLGIEILSLPLYVLAGIHGWREGSREAAVKYVLLGAFSSGILLYGMALTYGATGSLALSTIGTDLSKHAGPLALVGIALLLVGLAFKLALVPFHSWTPDVYEGSPIPVTSFMSVGTKAAALAGLARVLLVAFPYVYAHWQPVLWGLAGLTMLMGNLMALRQTSMKRLMGYSGIAHAGYVATAIVAGSALGIFASVYYLIAYVFMNLGIFAVVQGLSRGDEEGDRLTSYRGLFYRRPVVAGAMILFLMSLASIPPTAGFLSKLTILLAVVQGGFWPLAGILVLSTLIGLYVYLKIILVMFDRTPEVGVSLEEVQEVAAAAEPSSRRIPAAVWVVMAIAVWGTLQFGILPGPVLHILGSTSLLAP